MWDERYNTPEFVYGKTPNTFLAANSHYLPKGKVLCLAEGEGRNGVYLAKQGYQVEAVDGSKVGMQKAQALAKAENVPINTTVADLAEYTIQPNTYSGIVSIFCHLPKSLRVKIHKQVLAGLQQGGVFILEAYTPAQLTFATGGPKDIDMLMTLVELKNELQCLDVILGQETEREVIEGTFHTGRAAVVQVIAIKR
jgi:SAM-dependent methyltransferase